MKVFSKLIIFFLHTIHNLMKIFRFFNWKWQSTALRNWRMSKNWGENMFMDWEAHCLGEDSQSCCIDSIQPNQNLNRLFYFVKIEKLIRNSHGHVRKHSIARTISRKKRKVSGLYTEKSKGMDRVQKRPKYVRRQLTVNKGVRRIQLGGAQSRTAGHSLGTCIHKHSSEMGMNLTTEGPLAI